MKSAIFKLKTIPAAMAVMLAVVVLAAIVLLCPSGTYAQAPKSLKGRIFGVKHNGSSKLKKKELPAKAGNAEPQPEPQDGTSAETSAETPAETPVALDAEGVSALLEELKTALPQLVTGEDDAAGIIQKWDAREDLAGNTKSQILELLFEDVKAVIADEGLRKAIWDSWTPSL